jgi:hypothetical protein
VSISPIFYEQLFHTKVFCATFMCLQFEFVMFWQKDFGTKAAHKMLVKLTPGTLFLPSLTIPFSYLSSAQKKRFYNSNNWPSKFQLRP